MDMMLEEELIDLMTFCLQNPESLDISEKHTRIKEIGQEIFDLFLKNQGFVNKKSLNQLIPLQASYPYKKN